MSPVAVTAAWLALFTLSTLAGAAAVGARLRHAEHERQRLLTTEATEAAVRRHVIARERAKIVRELHDVIGHTVMATTLQIGSARLLLTNGDSERATATLRNVEDAGHDAMSDLRGMLGILDLQPEHAAGAWPPPGETAA